MIKTLTRTSLAAILACVWAVPAYTQSLAAAASTATTLRAIYTVEKGQPFTIHLMDTQGKLVSQLATKPVSADLLSKYLPSQISKNLSLSAAPQVAGQTAQTVIPAALTAQGAKAAAGFSFGRMALEKLMRFPIETLGFFVSLGAIVTYDLMTNATANPVGFQQLIDSQLDPVGQLGFYAFMLANGATAEPFMHMIQQGKLNPRFAPLLVYGGMSIGMVASNIVHEVGHWPGLGQCAKELWSTQTRNLSKNKYDNCDKAAAHCAERGGFGGITNQWAPGLISLIGSTLLASAIQGYGKVVFSSVSKSFAEVVLWSGRWTFGKIVQIAAIEIGLTLLPAGGIVMRGVRVIGPTWNFLAQVTLFNWITHLIEAPLTRTYNLNTQGYWLKNLDSQLAKQLMDAKEQSWSADSAEGMSAGIQEFAKQMQQWRQMNLAEVLTGQANWEQKLGQVSMSYRASHDFYMDFLGRIWERQHGRYQDSYARGESVSILDRNFPLNGVKVAEANTDDETTWLEAPDMIEGRQIQTIQSVVQSLNATGLTGADLQKFEQIKSSLTQTNRQKIGQALDRLNCLLHMVSSPNCQWESNSAKLTEALMSLRKLLGEPRPIWQSGLGYLIAYQNTPGNKAIIDRTSYGKSWDFLSTPRFGESMIASMFYGPDSEKGQSSVIFSNGYADGFKAPRVKIENGWTPTRQNSSQTTQLTDIFNSGIYNFLNRGGVRSSVVNANPHSFRDWWKKYPETDYMKAWLDYERKYQGNIVLMIKSWNRPDDKSSTTDRRSAILDPKVLLVTKAAQGLELEKFTRSPISVSVLKAFQQEVKFYLMVLGEFQKDQLLSKMKAIPPELLSETKRLINLEKDGDQLQILSLLRNNNTLDFSAYLRLQGQKVSSAIDSNQLSNLKWQEQTLGLYNSILSLFDRLQVRSIQVPSGEVAEMPVSTLDSKELKDKADSLRAYLKELQEIAFNEMTIENESQAKMAQLCFQALEKILSEMQSYAEAANAASYLQRHDGQGYTSRRCNLAKPQTGLGGMQAVQRAAEGC